ncbi:alkaline phosphatase family protein [Roseivirga sp. E12]|uniref:alkaline phosphatase family protein n=1 Tax=Roseivirga sp. E12 TaxID=2819237 RepID=UPI00351C2E7D
MIRFLALALISALFASACQSPPKERKVVFILLDGIPADVLEASNTPYLDEIADETGYTRAYVGGEKGGASESPTISAVGYNSLLTGTWANKHNVWGNSIKAPNYDYWSIFRIAKEHNPNLKTAIFSTWLDNRTKLIGEGLPETGNLKMDYAFDGFELDTVRFPHDAERQYILNIDEMVATETADYIASDAPDLSWVYLEYTDDMGHRYGDSPQMAKAVELADAQVGRIWKAVQQREAQYDEDWLIIITTDHGRTAVNGKGHGGQSDRERTTWIVTNYPKPLPSFYQNPGIVDIMPSIVNYMDLTMPKEIAEGIDGEAFIGR